MSSINHLESIDSGSNYKFGNKMEVAKNPRSLFDLSHLVTTTIDNAGMVIPLTWFETIPGDDFDLSADSLLRVMPQVVPLYSRQRLYLYAFYSRIGDLWNNFDVFMTKGYSGNDTSHNVPVLNSSNLVLSWNADGTSQHGVDSYKKLQPCTLMDYLGLPIGIDYLDSNADFTTAGQKPISSAISNANISALPFMMYMRIWRDYFINKNHFINDRIILPDDDSRFRLDDDGQLLSAKDQNCYLKFDVNIPQIHNYRFFNNIAYFGLFSHLYPSDYFTSALPFTQRGTAATLPIDVSGITAQTVTNVSTDTIVTTNVSSAIDFANTVVNNGITMSSLPNNLYWDDETKLLWPTYESTSDEHTYPIRSKWKSDLVSTLNKAVITNTASSDAVSTSSATSNTSINGVASTNIIWNDIRKLAQQQQELEKMARTDGSYGGFGITFFGEKSKNARDYKPYYIGGVYKNIAFTEVLQTAGSSVGTTDPESSSPLGAQAGHGITGMSDARLGHVHCDDYGIIMILGCIMPDIYYSQGLDKKWTRHTQADMYVPERARLGLVPILNKELYFAGNNGNEQGDDNYLWAYQNPFDELRYCQNRISGKIADPNNKSFYPYTQARYFNELPNWGYQFSEATNVRKDYLFAKNEAAYTAQFSFNIRAVRQLPYKPIPAKLI